MKTLAFAAGLVCVLASTGAWAADLDDDGGSADRRSYVYEDPRYADIYREPRRLEPPPPDYRYRPLPPPAPAPYAYRPEPPRYSEPPPRYVEPPRYVPPPRYAESDRSPYGRPEDCARKDDIRQRLIDGGWRDFHDPRVHGPVADIKARRANGDLYDLRVNRCSGEVEHARKLESGRRPIGPYAYDDLRPGWRRY